MIPSIPFTDPKIASMDASLSDSLKTPTSEAFIAHVGPPDCATAMFIIIFYTLLKNSVVSSLYHNKKFKARLVFDLKKYIKIFT
jgi:hypothetical protein